MTSRIQMLRNEVRKRRRQRPRHPLTISLDVAGTDHGIEVPLQGAFDAVTEYPSVSVICCGPLRKMEDTLRQRGWQHPRILLEEATEVVGMHEAPKETLKKRDSSVTVAARLVREGRAQGMVSAGNTGATMATAMFQWRQLPGISRPAIVAIMPNPKRPTFILDVGANVDCKPRHLFQFAIMGSIYAHYVYHRRNPRVGILSIGEEETKGNEQVFETQKLLRASTLNFHGNAEGRDLFRGTFDVVVCDGFVGNVTLKSCEAVADFIMHHLKHELNRNIVSQLGALAMMPAFRSFRKQIDVAEYGGGPLLGLNGTCIICHGSSGPLAIKNAIGVASDQVASKVNEHIIEAVRINSERIAPVPA